MSVELDKLREHLESLETFFKSSAHVGYVAAREEEVKNLEAAIVAMDPIDRATEIEGFKLRGELRSQQGMISIFEDARVTLKDRIDQMAELENQNATETKV